MSFKYLLSTGILLLCFSCKTPQERFLAHKGEMMTIGFGGGFTGEYKEFSLFDNGGVYHFNTITEEREYFGKIDKNVTKQLFNNYVNLGLNKKLLNNPGNMSYYLVYKGEKINHKLLWSKMEEINPELRIFYDILMDNFKKIKK